MLVKILVSIQKLFGNIYNTIIISKSQVIKDCQYKEVGKVSLYENISHATYRTRK